MKYLLILIFGLFINHISAQNLDRITNENNKIESFYYIENTFDLSKKNKIAVLYGSSWNSKMKNLYTEFNRLWKIANKLGANSFKFDKSNHDREENAINFSISIYKLSEEELQQNWNQTPKNKVFVFGDIINKDTKHQKVKINKQSYLLRPYEYLQANNGLNQKITIKIGGLTGATTWIKGKEGKLPEHFSLSGFSIDNNVTLAGQFGVGFNTGRIHPIDFDFGQLLVHLLSKKPVTVK